MLLEGKVAVVYGAGGSIGAPTARAFAREGARVSLAGRTRARLAPVAAAIAAAGGAADVAEVDALDEAAVEAHLAGVVEAAGRIDVLFNAIGMEDVQGRPLTEMAFEDFFRPIAKAARSQFLTARAAGRQMASQGAGVIITVTAGPPEATANVGGFGPACEMIEGLWRGLAAELSPKGVRVVGLRSAGSPELGRLPGHARPARRRRRRHPRRARLEHADGPAAFGGGGGRGRGARRLGPGERAHRHLRARDLRLARGLT